MDKQLLQQYFKCINKKSFCENYNIWYEHLVDVLNWNHKLGKVFSNKVQNAMLWFHDDLIEMSQSLMQKPKKKSIKKSCIITKNS